MQIHVYMMDMSFNGSLTLTGTWKKDRANLDGSTAIAVSGNYVFVASTYADSYVYDGHVIQWEPHTGRVLQGPHESGWRHGYSSKR